MSRMNTVIVDKNDDILLIHWGDTFEGYDWCMGEREWKKLTEWCDKNEIYCYENGAPYKRIRIARNITPKQMEKFDEFYWCYTDCAKLIQRELGEGFVDCEEEIHKQKFVKIAEEMDISKFNPRAVLGKLDFDRRAEEDGIKWG